MKCDRGHPSCGWCSRNGQICEYKERKKPGLRAGYGRELEQRLDRLEDVLRSHSRILDAHFGPSSVSTNQPSPQTDVSAFRTSAINQVPVPQIPPSADAAIFLQKPHLFQASQANSPPLSDYSGQLETPTPLLPQQNGFPPPPPTSDAIPQSGISQVPHMSQGVHGFYPPPSAPPLDRSNMGISNGVGPVTTQDQELPPYDLLYSLVDLYFKHINTWIPLLHRKTTIETLFRPSTLDEADRIMLHAIVATTLRFSNDPRLDEASRRRYHDTSKQKVVLYGLENSSVKAVQAMVILALDLTGSSNGPPGWNLLALITRAVVQLGLAAESTSSLASPKFPSIATLGAAVLPEPMNWIEEESRRRLFWAVYLLDRYTTIATSFEFALDDKEIDRKLPCRDDLFSRNRPVETRWFRTPRRTDYSLDRPENLGYFSYYIEVLGILSRIHQFLRKPVDISAIPDVETWQRQYRELEGELTTWYSKLPSEYGNISRLFNLPNGNKVVNCGWVMLHATYHTVVIRINSSAAYPTIRSSIFAPSYSASQRCLTAVENIATLGRFVVGNGMLNKLGPPFAFTIWVAARLLLVHGSTFEHRLSPDIQFFVDTLREMGQYWKVAERYTTILQRVLDEHRESERAAGAGEERVTPSSVRILADMRRCAYDLDVLISRQPRQPVSQAVPAAFPRAPEPNELEYLDVFNFFNLPRLPVTAAADGMMPVPAGDGIKPGMPAPQMQTGNEFNITNFAADVHADWLFKQGA
ncbi:hypothetical protein L228DRAFT_93698 [Xylona heveae TC161]|uniref:Xylanolytic transcriptional activator regulatory domain-containing protein n=1 Tax=Xylona heveae (strain CBS 132557 / TC161) TaxID=1328760 RepID=A0A165I2T4_XYLHT|nr:hypothetical protein L228DRAFT_93698 [Xylona heveae TC161]KZF24291.1 hypothetical protein L228DRAFT_93698 [Xylona heveae TC161]